MYSWFWKKLLNDESLEVTVVISQFFCIFQKKSQKNKKKNDKKCQKKLWVITASYGTRVLESVFKIKVKALAEEFESIETFPGFVHLLGEN